MMKTSEKGIALIKSFEGCHLTAYLCPAGVWTIGYGHTAGVKEGQVITQAQADNFLKEDLAKHEKYVTATGLSLNQNQFDALVSFTYNCGNGNLKTLIANRTLAEIAEAILLYNKSKGKVLDGLVKRRKAEQTLFLENEQEVEVKMIKPVDYKQTDTRWKSNKYAVDGESSTIGSAGCGPTALADCLAAIVSPYIDPLTLAAWSRDHNYKVKASGTSYNFFVPCAAAYGVKVRRLNTSTVYGKSNDAVHSQVLAELQAGNWIIACMGKGIWTSSGHYVVAYGYQGGNVYINDPASTKANRACNLWSTFISQVKYYWVVEVPDYVRKAGIVQTGDYRQEDFVREVQLTCGAGIDGIAGSQTLSKTVTVSKSKNNKHNVVLPLQKLLKVQGRYVGALDRISGNQFKDAVNSYQKYVLKYKNLDGEVTAKGKMWKSLLGLC